MSNGHDWRRVETNTDRVIRTEMCRHVLRCRLFQFARSCTFGACPRPKDACGYRTYVISLWPKKRQPLATAELLALQHGQVELALTTIMHTARISFRGMTTKRTLCHSFIPSTSGTATLPSKHSTYVRRLGFVAPSDDPTLNRTS
jgi:hypothetical protein